MAETMGTLIPVGKKTGKSLGILSFDPAGAFRLEGNRWLWIYEAEENVGCMVAEAMYLQGTVRITMHLRGIGGRETCHISLMESGEGYREAYGKMTQDAEKLRKHGILRQLSVDEVMNLIAGNFYTDTRFSYASFVRSHKDWEKECFGRVTESDDRFHFGTMCGESFSALVMPPAEAYGIIRDLYDIGCEMYVCLDVSPIPDAEKGSFMRSLEKQYNKRLLPDCLNGYVNAGLSVVVICDSEEVIKIVAESLASVCDRHGFCTVPALGRQKAVLVSALDDGITYEKLMRNVRADTLEKILGGSRDEDAKIEV